MVAGEDFLLKWNDHHTLFFAGAEELVTAEEYTDVTLAAGTRFFAAHRLVLSICSPYFRQLFKRLGGERTVIFLKDVEPKHLELLLEYMYKGEIKVEETELVNVLNTAQSLEIRGLTDSGQKSDQPTKSKPPSTLSSAPIGSKRPLATSSPPVGSNHHLTESHTTATPARKRVKAAAAVVKVKAEEVDLRDDDEDVIHMGRAAVTAATTDNDWSTLGTSSGGGGSSSLVVTDSVGQVSAVVQRPDAGSGGDDYDEQDYGGGGGGEEEEGGTVATGYEEMGYEGEDYYAEEGMMPMGEGDDRVECVEVEREGGSRSTYRVWKCRECGHMTKSKANIMKHAIVHSGSRPFSCSYCYKGFSDPSNRNRHERTKHGPALLGVSSLLSGHHALFTD